MSTQLCFHASPMICAKVNCILKTQLWGHDLRVAQNYAHETPFGWGLGVQPHLVFTSGLTVSDRHTDCADAERCLAVVSAKCF